MIFNGLIEEITLKDSLCQSLLNLYRLDVLKTLLSSDKYIIHDAVIGTRFSQY